MARYSKIEGILNIYKNGEIYVGSKRLYANDVMHLKVRTLKQIIRDAKKGDI